MDDLQKDHVEGEILADQKEEWLALVEEWFMNDNSMDYQDEIMNRYTEVYKKKQTHDEFFEWVGETYRVDIVEWYHQVKNLE